MTAAYAANAERKAKLAKEYEEFKAPLVAPASNDDRDWGYYVGEAFSRVVPASNAEYPAFEVLPLGGPEFAERDRWLLRKAFDRVLEGKRDVVLGCADPAQLIRALHKVVAELPPNALQGARVYVAVTPDSREAMAQAVAPLGAAFVALDVTVPIPQVPARLEHLRQFQEDMESVR